MIILLAFIGTTIFLIGLYQWAQSGASLWRIFRMRRSEKNLSRSERAEVEGEVRKLEQAADRTLGASFRILAFLAVFVWVVLGVTMVLEMFGIDWIGAVSSRARTYWSQPGVTSSVQTVPGRNDMLRNMGNNLRR